MHAHFVAVDPFRGALLVTGEHTGNLGVVDTRSRNLQQVVAISRPIPGCVADEDPEPHVHGVNVQTITGRVYVSDEGEDCFYESVTILKPRHRTYMTYPWQGIDDAFFGWPVSIGR
ncbi:MAG TPA: hypothetical protein ENK53_02065 [Thiotrichales bacterium]|nr:hypothetical protein [Thiotrichales bacterium]